jgi:hypothetical protein
MGCNSHKYYICNTCLRIAERLLEITKDAIMVLQSFNNYGIENSLLNKIIEELKIDKSSANAIALNKDSLVLKNFVVLSSSGKIVEDIKPPIEIEETFDDW